jgi:hypothetical protein
MGVLNFIWDASQEGRLGRHDEEIEALKKDMETARAWIEHLVARIEVLEKERHDTNT